MFFGYRTLFEPEPDLNVLNPGPGPGSPIYLPARTEHLGARTRTGMASSVESVYYYSAYSMYSTVCCRLG